MESVKYSDIRLMIKPLKIKPEGTDRISIVDAIINKLSDL